MSSPGTRGPSNLSEPGEPQASSSRLSQRLQRVAQILSRRPSPKVERVLIGLAFLAFVAAAIIAFRQLPSISTQIRWGILIGGGLVGVLATLATNAAEYVLMGSLLGHSIRWGEAIRISVLSSAANLMPIPGGVLVRTHALRLLGSTYRRSLASTMVVGTGWLGVTALLAGASQVLFSNARFGAILLVGAVPVLAISLIATKALTGNLSSASGVFIVESLSVAATAFRLWVVLAGLGITAAVPVAIALSLATVLASAVAVFPGGLGLREFISAGIAPMVGLAAVGGLAASVVDRILGLVFNSVLGGILLMKNRFSSQTAATPGEGEA